MQKKRYQRLVLICSCVVLSVFLIYLCIGKMQSLADGAYSEITGANEKVGGSGAVPEENIPDDSMLFIPNN